MISSGPEGLELLLPNGVYTLFAWANDTSGHISLPVNKTFTINTNIKAPISIIGNIEFPKHSSQGNGTESNPYIIENLIIDGESGADCIFIENTNVFFILRNCHLFNGYYGIRTWNVVNGQLINNIIEDNAVGLIIMVSKSFDIINNTVKKSSAGGISIYVSGNCTISNNTVINSVSSGIDISHSNDTQVFDNFLTGNYQGISIFGQASHNYIYNNIAFNNSYTGIHSGSSIGYNRIFKNFANNNTWIGISTYMTQNEFIYNNTANYNGWYGFDLTRSSNFTVSFNNANHNKYGMDITCNDSLVNNNFVNNNTEYGIKLGGNNNRILNNTANFNMGGGWSYKDDGINIYGSNTTVINNIANYNERGIVINSGNAVLYNNSAGFNEENIRIFESRNLTMSKNIFHGGGLWIGGVLEDIASYHIDTINLVNGKPIYYYSDQTFLNPVNFTNAGQIVLVNCNNSKVSDINISYTSVGITLLYSHNNTISNSTVNYSKYGIFIENSNRNNISCISANNASDSGIYLSLSHYNRLSNNRLYYNLHGIYLLHSNNTIILKTFANLNLWSGIYLDYANNTQISNNTADYNSAGIYSSNSYNNTISNNTLNNNDWTGIALLKSGNTTLSKNIVNYNSAGVDVQLSDNCIIFRNFAFNNRGVGIILSSSDHGTVSNNSINQNEDGIFLSSSMNNTVSQNNVMNNRDIGIAVYYSLNNYILFNFITNNSNIGIYLRSSGTYVIGNILRNNNNCIYIEKGYSGNIFEGNDCGLDPPTLGPILPNPNLNGTIYLNWDDVVGATFYYIYRDISPIISVIGLKPISKVTQGTYIDTMTMNDTYYYVIVAGCNADNSSVSNCENITVEFSELNPPTLEVIQPNPDADGIIYLSWGSVSGATIYHVYRDSAPITSVVGLTPIASLNISYYTDNLSTDGTYYYVVIAGNYSGTYWISSQISNCENITVTIAPTPEGPDILFIILLSIIIIGVVSASSLAIYSIKRRSRVSIPPFLTKKFKNFSLAEKIRKTIDQNIPLDKFDKLDIPELRDLLLSEIGIISPEIEQCVAKLPISDIEKEEILQELARMPSKLQKKLLNQLENDINNI